MGLLGSPHLTDSSGTNAWGLLARGAHAGRGGGTVNTAGCVPSPCHAIIHSCLLSPNK